MVEIIASRGASRSSRPNRDIFSSRSSGTASMMSQEFETASRREEDMWIFPGCVLCSAQNFDRVSAMYGVAVSKTVESLS